MRVKPSLAMDKIRIGTYNRPLSWNLPNDTLTRMTVGLNSAQNSNSIRAKPDQSRPPGLCLPIRALSIPHSCWTAHPPFELTKDIHSFDPALHKS